MSNDERSEEELKRAAEALLKGCSQHFGAQVTRLRKTKAVIPHGRASEFEQLVDSLQNAADPASFDSIADRLLNAFPAVHNWLAVVEAKAALVGECDLPWKMRVADIWAQGRQVYVQKCVGLYCNAG